MKSAGALPGRPESKFSIWICPAFPRLKRRRCHSSSGQSRTLRGARLFSRLTPSRGTSGTCFKSEVKMARRGKSNSIGIRVRQNLPASRMKSPTWIRNRLQFISQICFFGGTSSTSPRNSHDIRASRSSALRFIRWLPRRHTGLKADRFEPITAR